MSNWEILNSKIAFECRWFKIIKDQVKLPSGTLGEYNYVQKTNSVLIVPVIDNSRLILIKQYRHPAAAHSWEFPSGAKKNDNFLDDARAELEEETGHRAEQFVTLGSAYPLINYSDEQADILLAKDLVKTAQRLDALEEGMEVGEFSFDEIEEMIHSNIIKDCMTVHAYYLAKKYLDI